MDCGCRRAGCWRRPSKQQASPPTVSGSSVQQHALPQTFGHTYARLRRQRAADPTLLSPTAVDPGVEPVRLCLRWRADPRPAPQGLWWLLRTDQAATRDRSRRDRSPRMYQGVRVSDQSSMRWSITTSRSARKRPASTRGAREAASARVARDTNRRGRMGRSSATGVPLRETMMVRPASTSRRTAAD